MAELLLIQNVYHRWTSMARRIKASGIRWQVPWGKQTPPGDEESRLKHTTLKSHPYVWMNRYAYVSKTSDVSCERGAVIAGRAVYAHVNLRESTPLNPVILAHPLAHRTACSMCRIE